MTIDAQILQTLRGAGDGSVSVFDLSEAAGLSRAAVSARIEQLRALGYDIEASPHRGYRLVSSPDALHAEDLLVRLGTGNLIGRDIRVFEKTTSTNDVVEKFARDGVREGVVVFAETQTRGRGRLGRKWLSPARKGLWFSILLRPRLRPPETTRLTVASATAIRRALRSQTKIPIEIKWPNDLLARGKKVAGILTEMSAQGDRVKYVVQGIGVDVNQTETEFPPELRELATSLAIETGRSHSRSGLAVAMLQELNRDYARVTEDRFDEIADEWESHCTTIGQSVVVRLGQREIRGRAESLGEDGALMIRTDHGHLERVIAGDVILDKPALSHSSRLRKTKR